LDKEKIVETANELIRFRTTADRPGELKACADYIESFFAGTGLAVHRFEWEEKPSLVIAMGGDLKGQEVMLNGHFDVVPADDDAQFTPVVKGDRLYGRGASDMKGSVAAMMVLMKALWEKGSRKPLALMLNGDEEIGGYNGAKRFVEMGYKPGFFLAGEPTGNRIGYAARGILRVKVCFRGRSAHGARPWEGENAVLACIDSLSSVRFLFDSQRPRQMEVTSFTPTIIRGGDVINRVPEKCCVSFDIRYVPEDKPEVILSQLQEAFAPADIEVIMQENPAYCPPDNPWITKLKEIVADVTGVAGELIVKYEGSDARFFAAAGVPAIVFGPSGDGWHGAEEWISLRQLFEFYRILEGLVETLPEIEQE